MKPSTRNAPIVHAFEAFAYSSLLAGAVAAAIVVAVESALELAVDGGIAALAGSGTIAVYNLDRLRDTARDRADSPARTAFVERHAGALRALLIGALSISAFTATQLDPAGVAICAAVLSLGLAHRRLKRLRGIKTLYLVVSWTAITVALPAFGVSHSRPVDPAAVAWVLWIIAPALTANMLASNLERADAPGTPSMHAKRRKLSIAMACAGLGLASATVAPGALQPLGAVAGLQFVALTRYRDSEAYRATVVDGSLLAGAIVSIAWISLG